MYDVSGFEINQATWLHLFADPARRWTLRTHAGRGREVVTSWHGVARQPGDPLFETSLYYRPQCPGGRPGQLCILPLAEHVTRAEALDGHAVWVKEARRGPVPGELGALDEAATRG